MATINSAGKVEFAGGEALPAIGTESYTKAQMGILPTFTDQSIQAVGKADIISTTPTTLNLPTTKTPTADLASSAITGLAEGANNSLQGLISQTTGETQNAQQAVTEGRSNLKSLFERYLKRGEVQAQEEQNAGLNDKLSVARGLSTEYQTTQLAQNAQYNSILNRPGGTMEQKAIEISSLQRQNSLNLADLSIRSAIASNDYNTAKAIVDRKVELQYAPLKDIIDYQRDLLGMDQTILSKKEENQLRVQLEGNERQYEEGVYNTRKLEDTKLSVLQEAQKNNAPQNVLRDIQRARTPSDAMAAAGNYIGALEREKLEMDREDRVLDQALKEAQIYSDMNPGQPVSPDGKIILPQKDKIALEEKVGGNDAYKAVRKAQDSLQFLSQFEQLFNKYGSTSAVFDPKKNKELESMYNTTILNLKEFFNLGVLNGPDEKILRGVLPDPTNKSNFLRTVSLGGYDPAAATKSGLDNMKKMIETTLDDRYQSLYNQYGQYDLNTIKDLDRIYVEQKAKINPQVGEMMKKEGLSERDVLQVLFPNRTTSFNSGGASSNAQRIANAIKTVESGGNYQARGASTEGGAYQFMPSTWKQWSREILGNPSAPMTPENQDRVAIAKISDWLNKGYNEAEIALMWNGGEPKVKRGVNRYGVKYDSGAYAKEVLSVLNNRG